MDNHTIGLSCGRDEAWRAIRRSATRRGLYLHFGEYVRAIPPLVWDLSAPLLEFRVMEREGRAVLKWKIVHRSGLHFGCVGLLGVMSAPLLLLSFESLTFGLLGLAGMAGMILMGLGISVLTRVWHHTQLRRLNAFSGDLNDLEDDIQTLYV